VNEQHGPGSFNVIATLRPGKKVEEVEAAIYEERDRLMKEPISSTARSFAAPGRPPPR